MQAIISLGETEDRILTIVKGKFGLKNKSDAVNLIIGKYAEQLLSPELRPEYSKEILNVHKGKHTKVASVDSLRAIFH